MLFTLKILVPPWFCRPLNETDSLPFRIVVNSFIWRFLLVASSSLSRFGLFFSFFFPLEPSTPRPACRENFSSEVTGKWTDRRKSPTNWWATWPKALWIPTSVSEWLWKKKKKESWSHPTSAVDCFWLIFFQRFWSESLLRIWSTSRKRRPAAFTWPPRTASKPKKARLPEKLVRACWKTSVSTGWFSAIPKDDRFS